MITIQVKNIEGITLPVPATTQSAGYDLIAIDDPKIVGEIGSAEEVGGKSVIFYRSIDYLEYHTGLYIAPQPVHFIPGNPIDTNYHTLIHPRSSIRKYNLVLANSIGLIDNDYRGEIIVCFRYVWQPNDLMMETVEVPTSDGGTNYTWEPNGHFLCKINYDKIYKRGDAIAQLVVEETVPANFILVSELDKTIRGEGGFGSSDNIIPFKKSPSGREMNYPQVHHIIEREMKKAESPPSNIKITETTPDAGGLSIVEKYQQAGGVPVRKKYGDEMKEKNKQ
jgi:dUTPase